MAALSNPFQRGSQGWGTLIHQNHDAGGGNSSIMVGIFVCLCLVVSKKPSEREFFVPARTDLGVKLLRPWCIFYFLFFRCSICCPKQWVGVPPRAPCPVRLRSNTPPTGSTNYWVDCCLKSPSGGHLRPEPGTSLYFFVHPIPTLQLMEPTTAWAHRTPHASFRPIGIGDAKI